MGNYEKNYLLSNHPWSDSIILYRRYIDDLVFIWDNTEEEFTNFTQYLNDNNYGLTLSGEINKEGMNYLDFTLSFENNKITTENFFKKVDSNNYLDYQSCQHRKCLQNIPYGQFRRIRRNCSKTADYRKQSTILMKKFKEKKYPNKIISNTYQKEGKLTQGDCLVSKKKSTENNDKFRSSFLTAFNFQHHEIRRILQTHWHILLNDIHLQKYIPPNPLIIYRWAKTLKNKLAPSELKEPGPSKTPLVQLTN